MVASRKRKQQYRTSKCKARQLLRQKPRVHKAFKKIDAARKKKKRSQEGLEKMGLLQRIEALTTKMQKQKEGAQRQKEGYLANMAAKENADEKGRLELIKYAKEQKAKTVKWEGFWKRLPPNVQATAVARSRGHYPKNCPQRGWHKDKDYWDPRISERL